MHFINKGKILSDLPMPHLILFFFTCLCPLLQKNLKDANYKNCSNILMKNGVRFEYFPLKMSGFVSFSLFEFTLVIILKNFDFKSHWNTSIFFEKKNKWWQIWICPVNQCLMWFKLCYLSRLLGISWEIRILNFIEIV